MKRVLCIILLVTLSGCATVCKSLTQTKLAQARATMQSLQEIYETNVEIWKITGASDVRAYAAAVYLALDVVGTVIATGCADKNGLANAQEVVRKNERL